MWTSLHLTGLPLLAVHGQLVSVALKDLYCPTVMEKKIRKAVLFTSTCFYLEKDTKGTAAQQLLGLRGEVELVKKHMAQLSC